MHSIWKNYKAKFNLLILCSEFCIHINEWDWPVVSFSTSTLYELNFKVILGS